MTVASSSMQSVLTQGRRPVLCKDLWLAIMRGTQFVCVACGSDAAEVEHVRPVAAGGTSLLVVNLVPVCKQCNRVKSCLWPYHGYHPFDDANDPAWAADILEAELRWVEQFHGNYAVVKHLWAEDGEPGAWLYRRLADGRPKWLYA